LYNSSIILSFFSLDVEGKSYSNKSLFVSSTVINLFGRRFAFADSRIVFNSGVIFFSAQHFLYSSQKFI
jgi:hypothetical protein